MTHLFTPRLNSTDQTRLTMQLSKADIAKVKHGGAWRAKVTDTVTGNSYLVRGAKCSLPGCHCDAVILKRLPAA